MEDYVFYINRPHAVERFITRAGLADGCGHDEAESMLRKGLSSANKNGLYRNRVGDAFLLRVALPGLNVVYAVLEPLRKDRHKYLVRTFLDQEMYQTWSKEGKLTTLSDALDVATKRKLQLAVAGDTNADRKDPQGDR